MGKQLQGRRWLPTPLLNADISPNHKFIAVLGITASVLKEGSVPSGYSLSNTLTPARRASSPTITGPCLLHTLKTLLAFSSTAIGTLSAISTSTPTPAHVSNASAASTVAQGVIASNAIRQTIALKKIQANVPCALCPTAGLVIP